MVEDSLSKKYEDVEVLLCSLFIIQLNWIIEAREEWKNDPSVWSLIQQLQIDPSVTNNFVWNNDSLWYKNCLYIFKESQIKQKVLLELHTSPIGGYLGFLETYHRVKKELFWEGLKYDVQRFIAKCLVCQQNKVETIKTSCLL